MQASMCAPGWPIERQAAPSVRLRQMIRWPYQSNFPLPCTPCRPMPPRTGRLATHFKYSESARIVDVADLPEGRYWRSTFLKTLRDRQSKKERGAGALGAGSPDATAVPLDQMLGDR